MMKTKYSLCLILAMVTSQILAVSGRHPTGVNVNSNGPTTVVITFHNIQPTEQPVDAFWCGDVTTSGVVVGTNPCVSGTLLGHLPRQLDISRLQAAATIDPDGNTDLNQGQNNNLAGPRNMTDVMSIPTAVIRRAYQEAQRGASSEFFYVRQFVNNGISTYVTVTCRMAGGGARTPLSLTKVDLNFNDFSSRNAVTVFQQSEQIENFSASINYTGSGLLKGRWELVMPGDAEPTHFDLLSEASLPIEERPLQKRYRLISRFQKFLPPTGRAVIPGPDPRLLPTMATGLHRILFRIEASNDKEGNTNTLRGIAATGGAAGFAMPTLRYLVSDSKDSVANGQNSDAAIKLLLPQNKQRIRSNNVKFSWLEPKQSANLSIYRIEFYQADKEQSLLTSALLKPSTTTYTPTQTILKKLNSGFYWRIVALNKNGDEIHHSSLRYSEIIHIDQ